MKRKTKKKSEIGASMVEYTILLLLLTMFAFSAAKMMGIGAHTVFSSMGQNLEDIQNGKQNS